VKAARPASSDLEFAPKWAIRVPIILVGISAWGFYLIFSSKLLRPDQAPALDLAENSAHVASVFLNHLFSKGMQRGGPVCEFKCKMLSPSAKKRECLGGASFLKSLGIECPA